MDPATSRTRVFAADGVKWKTVAPHGRLRLRVDVLDECRKHACLVVRTARGKEDVVRVPVDGEHS